MPSAFITGTSAGLGQAIAVKLLTQGWRVHGFSRQITEISHPNFIGYKVDITQDIEVQKTVALALHSEPAVDLLINNAGAASMNVLLLTPSKVAENLMRVNYLGAFHCLQAVGKQMVRQRRGLIINVTTVAVPLALEGEAAYVASKAALDALTKVAGKELKTHGVTVIGLGFGPIPTKLTRTVEGTKLQQLNAAIGRPHGTSLSDATEFIFEAIQKKNLVPGSISYLGKVSHTD